MLEWLLSTLMGAFPFLVPVAVLLITRIVGCTWPIQRLLVLVFTAFYALSLMAFAWHMWLVGTDVQEFFLGFYGHPAEKTVPYYLGLACQMFATLALLLAINWKVLRLFKGEDWRAPKAKEVQTLRREMAQTAAHEKAGTDAKDKADTPDNKAS